MSKSANRAVRIELTIEQAAALGEALDTFTRLSIGQLEEVATLARRGALPLFDYSKDTEKNPPPRRLPDLGTCNQLEELMLKAKTVLEYPEHGSFGVIHPHVALTGRRTFEVLTALREQFVKLKNPNANPAEEVFDGYGIRCTDDPAPIVTLLP